MATAPTRTSPSPEVTVILLCGLPGSGKSTLARKIKSKLEQPLDTENQIPTSVVHTEYDALEDELLLIASSNDDNDQQQQLQQEEDSEMRLEAWKQARSVALSELETKIEEWIRDGDVTTKSSLMILMDDNYHLRGMRKQVHRLLLKHRPIKFGLLWIETSLEDCIQRNRKRERKIPEHVITNMATSFEPPRAAWERNYIKIEGGADADVKKVMDFLSECSEIVDLPEDVVIDPKQQAEDRALTQSNQRHQFDKSLRSWVGLTAKYNKRLARSANESRKSLIEGLKEPDNDLGSESKLLDAFVDGIFASSSNVAISDDQLSELKSCLMAG